MHRKIRTQEEDGTSYAAPAVTGIVALIWEANENLTPLQIKEVLKHTSESRGEASAPEVDPYWNREFGWYGRCFRSSGTCNFPKR